MCAKVRPDPLQDDCDSSDRKSVSVSVHALCASPMGLAAVPGESPGAHRPEADQHHIPTGRGSVCPDIFLGKLFCVPRELLLSSALLQPPRAGNQLMSRESRL